MFGPLMQGIGWFREVLRRAGRQAERDVLRAAPPIALVARVAALFRPLPASWRGVAALLSLGILAAVVAALAV